MKKIFNLTTLILLFSFANAQIDEKIVCDITYYSDVSFEGLSESRLDNFEHNMNVIFYYDTKAQKLYNADKKNISNVKIDKNIIEVNWNSAEKPRFCFLIDKNAKTVKYKAYFELPPKMIGNTGIMTPVSVTKHNGHGKIEVQKL